MMILDLFQKVTKFQHLMLMTMELPQKVSGHMHKLQHHLTLQSMTQGQVWQEIEKENEKNESI